MNNDLIKQGAYYLLRGGTLLSEPCKKCGNLQIRYKGDIICMNCQHVEEHKVKQQDTSLDNIESKKAINDVMGEDDKKTPNNFDNFQEMLSQVERQIIQNIAKLNMDQDATPNLKKYKKYLEIIQTGLKTIEMIRGLRNI